MNRRSFIRNILAAGASCAILPSALTYARKWKTISVLDARYNAMDFAGVWQFQTGTYHSVRGLVAQLYPEYFVQFEDLHTRSNFHIIPEDKFIITPGNSFNWKT